MAEPESYLTVREVADRLGYAPGTVMDKMHDGTFIQGVHWFKRKGMRPLFKWSKVVEFIETPPPLEPVDRAGEIPMAKGYYLESGRRMARGYIYGSGSPSSTSHSPDPIRRKRNR